VRVLEIIGEGAKYISIELYFNRVQK